MVNENVYFLFLFFFCQIKQATAKVDLLLKIVFFIKWVSPNDKGQNYQKINQTVLQLWLK